MPESWEKTRRAGFHGLARGYLTERFQKSMKAPKKKHKEIWKVRVASAVVKKAKVAGFG